jgi:hypothetical protein
MNEMEEVPFDDFDERHAAIKKESVSLLLADDITIDSSTASIAISLYSDNQHVIETSIEVGNSSEDDSGSLDKGEIFGFSLVDEICPPADKMFHSRNESEDDFQSVADTIATDNSEVYTYFPKKTYRYRCHVDYGGSASEQSSPSVVLDMIDIWRGWFATATTDGEQAVQNFLDGPAPSHRSDGSSSSSDSIVKKSH